LHLLPPNAAAFASQGSKIAMTCLQTYRNFVASHEFGSSAEATKRQLPPRAYHIDKPFELLYVAKPQPLRVQQHFQFSMQRHGGFHRVADCGQRRHIGE
jgi:hypothetical protein